MGKATRERDREARMGVRVAGKGETEGKWSGIIMLPSLLFFCKCGHFFAVRLQYELVCSLVIHMCVGGVKTAERAVSRPYFFLSLPCSASGYSYVLCISSLL